MFLEFFSFRISSEFCKLSLSKESTFCSSFTCDLFQKSNCRKCKFSIFPTYFKNKADRFWSFYPILTLLRIVNNFFINENKYNGFWRFSPYPYRIARHKLAFYMPWARLNNVPIFFPVLSIANATLFAAWTSLNLLLSFLTFTLLKCFALLIFCIGWYSKLLRLFQIREHFSLLCLLSEYCFFDIPLYTILWATMNWSLVFLLSICSSVEEPDYLKALSCDKIIFFNNILSFPVDNDNFVRNPI